MKRFVDALQGQLIWDLRNYGRFEVINIYEDGWGIYAHIMIAGQPYTAAYDLNEFGVPPFLFVCIKEGFYRNRKDLLMIERVTRFDIMRLKERFHNEAVKNYKEALAYSDFHHLGYLLDECGGYSTAKMMMRQQDTMELHELAYYERLDLTMEHLVLNEDFNPLFTDRDRNVCKQRLYAYLQRPRTVAYDPHTYGAY